MTEKDEKSTGGWAELDLNNLGNQPELVLEPDETVETEDSSPAELVETKEETAEAVVETPAPKKENRSQQRIRQLVKERKARDEEIRQLKERLNASTQSEFSTKKASVDTIKHALDEAISAKTKEVTAALSSGDFEAYGKINNELTKLNLRKAALDSWEAKEPELEKVTPVAAEEVEVSGEEEDEDEHLTLEEKLRKGNVPEEGIKWIKENPEFVQNETFRNYALVVNQEMISEGKDPNSPEFYKALDKKLIEIGKKKGQKTKNNGPGVRGESPVPKVGADGKLKVTYTQEDVRTAESLGIPLKEYMKQKVKTEARYEHGGWSKVFK